ncbi:hypothetical protein [Streptomyces sp. CC219B]|uniref:hypothetical protein n=1 Tax=Streptomyces sp. CC219B TaxID=3044574 RepID=UPI0024A94985|nr:hypothetical protein [Streptomyces sp. CC219B]
MDAIEADGDEVIVPQDVAANLRTNLRSFPPVNQLYTVQEPVQLYAPDGSEASGGPVAGQLDGFDVIVSQSEG